MPVEKGHRGDATRKERTVVVGDDGADDRDQRAGREPPECSVDDAQSRDEQPGAGTQALDLGEVPAVQVRARLHRDQLVADNSRAVDDPGHAVAGTKGQNRAGVGENGGSYDGGEDSKRVFGHLGIMPRPRSRCSGRPLLFSV